MDLKIPAKYADDPVFLEMLAEGLAIQDQFSAEPVYAKTGKGYLKSVGVEEIQRAKEAARKKIAAAISAPPTRAP